MLLCVAHIHISGPVPKDTWHGHSGNCIGIRVYEVDMRLQHGPSHAIQQIGLLSESSVEENAVPLALLVQALLFLFI